MPLPSNESLAYLHEMLSTPSPSGFETKLQNVIRKHYEQFADEVHRDVHGNQWFVINPKGGIRVMLCGHVDEIGLMVRYIDDQGFIWVTRIGAGADAVVNNESLCFDIEFCEIGKDRIESFGIAVVFAGPLPTAKRRALPPGDARAMIEEGDSAFRPAGGGSNLGLVGATVAGSCINPRGRPLP